MPAPAAVDLRHLAATRYVTPLREGGSLPGLVEAEDDGLYVLKFRGAGQGTKALAAELIAGELGRALGLPVPDLVLLELDPAIGRAEPDAEIQDLLAASAGTNLGMDFLPGALTYSPVADTGIDPALAADVVWFDGLVTNVDRSPRNPNLLMWHGRLWVIDHGAALYVQHSWADPDAHARGVFPAIAEHVLLPVAGPIGEADARLASRVTPELLREVLAAVPVDWFGGEPAETYVRYLLRRLESPRPFVEEAERARLAPAESRPFQYVIVRVVPRIDRGEQLNAGVVLYSGPLEFLSARVQLDDDRLRALAPGADPAAIRPHLDAICAIAAGDPSGGPIAQFDRSRRFHWLAAPSSTVIQPSPIHTGMCDDPAAMLEHLFRELVLPVG